MSPGKANGWQEGTVLSVDACDEHGHFSAPYVPAGYVRPPSPRRAREGDIPPHMTSSPSKGSPSTALSEPEEPVALGATAQMFWDGVYDLVPFNFMGPGIRLTAAACRVVGLKSLSNSLRAMDERYSRRPCRFPWQFFILVLMLALCFVAGPQLYRMANLTSRVGGKDTGGVTADQLLEVSKAISGEVRTTLSQEFALLTELLRVEGKVDGLSKDILGTKGQISALNGDISKSKGDLQSLHEKMVNGNTVTERAMKNLENKIDNEVNAAVHDIQSKLNAHLKTKHLSAEDVSNAVKAWWAENVVAEQSYGEQGMFGQVKKRIVESVRVALVDELKEATRQSLADQVKAKVEEASKQIEDNLRASLGSMVSDLKIEAQKGASSDDGSKTAAAAAAVSSVALDQLKATLTEANRRLTVIENNNISDSIKSLSDRVNDRLDEFNARLTKVEDAIVILNNHINYATLNVTEIRQMLVIIESRLNTSILQAVATADEAKRASESAAETASSASKLASTAALSSESSTLALSSMRDDLIALKNAQAASQATPATPAPAPAPVPQAEPGVTLSDFEAVKKRVNDVTKSVDDVNQRVTQLSSDLDKEREDRLAGDAKVSQEIASFNDKVGNMDTNMKGVIANVATLTNSVSTLATNQASTKAQGSGNANTKEVTGLVNDIIDDKLEVFAADRTGRVDFAAKASGARISASSETYTESGAFMGLSSFWMSCYVPTKLPETVIESDGKVGNCWPMRGNVGFVEVELVGHVNVDAVSIQHASAYNTFDNSTVPKTIRIVAIDRSARQPTPKQDGRGKSAAKVAASSSEVVLGTVQYDMTNDQGKRRAIKTVEFPRSARATHVRFEVMNNHGHKGFTCLYRFRVHGSPILN